MKKYILLVSLFFALSAGPTSAQIQDTIITTVGSPTITATSSSSITIWAAQISQELQPGVWNYNNKLLARPKITNGSYTSRDFPATSKSNIFWCTQLIIDSYNLAGIPVGKNLIAVTGMDAWWRRPEQTSRGFRIIGYNNGTESRSTILALRPGDALMRLKQPGKRYNHVSMVYSINVNEHGDGQITLYDSNTNRKSVKGPVHGWKFFDPYWNPDNYRQLDFGLVR